MKMKILLQKIAKDISWNWADKRDYLRGYDDILHLNYRPSMNFTAYVESKCYLFGCKRHDNPDFLES